MSKADRRQQELAAILKRAFTHEQMATLLAQLLQHSDFKPLDCGRVQCGGQVLTIAAAVEDLCQVPF